MPAKIKKAPDKWRPLLTIGLNKIVVMNTNIQLAKVTMPVATARVFNGNNSDISNQGKGPHPNENIAMKISVSTNAAIGKAE